MTPPATSPFAVRLSKLSRQGGCFRAWAAWLIQVAFARSNCLFTYAACSPAQPTWLCLQLQLGLHAGCKHAQHGEVEGGGGVQQVGGRVLAVHLGRRAQAHVSMEGERVGWQGRSKVGPAAMQCGISRCRMEAGGTGTACRSNRRRASKPGHPSCRPEPPACASCNKAAGRHAVSVRQRPAAAYHPPPLLPVLLHTATCAASIPQAHVFAPTKANSLQSSSAKLVLPDLRKRLRSSLGVNRSWGIAQLLAS